MQVNNWFPDDNIEAAYIDFGKLFSLTACKLIESLEETKSIPKVVLSPKL